MKKNILIGALFSVMAANTLMAASAYEAFPENYGKTIIGVDVISLDNNQYMTTNNDKAIGSGDFSDQPGGSISVLLPIQQFEEEKGQWHMSLGAKYLKGDSEFTYESDPGAFYSVSEPTKEFFAAIGFTINFEGNTYVQIEGNIGNLSMELKEPSADISIDTMYYGGTAGIYFKPENKDLMIGVKASKIVGVGGEAIYHSATTNSKYNIGLDGYKASLPVAYRINDSWIVNGEYEYSSLKNSENMSLELDSNTVSLGIKYVF
jgi:opacity protein-like surface antigen